MATVSTAKAAPNKAKEKSIVTPIFRVSFPHAFEPHSMDGGAPKYGVTAVFDKKKFSDKDKQRWAAMEALANEVSMAKFKKRIKELPANFKKPIRDGAEKEGLDGFGPGLVFTNLTTKFKPGVIDKDGKTKIIDDPEAFYPGCYARATVTCYGYDNKGKGIAFGLMNLQKLGDGARLDSRTDAEDDFVDEDIDPKDQAWLDAQDAEADFEGEDNDGGF